jgi:hypothetical protein
LVVQQTGGASSQLNTGYVFIMSIKDINDLNDKHVSKSLVSFLQDCFDRTIERRHNKPAKDITWKEMTKQEHTIQLDIVAMKTRANKRGK